MMNRRVLLISSVLVLLFTGVGFSQVMLQSEQLFTMNAEIVVNADTGWPTKIILKGKCNQAKAWLGISLYPYNVSDPITGGSHNFVEVKKGTFEQEIVVNQRFLDGSFEVGLWGKKIDKVDSTDEYNYWDKMFGFHVDELLVYKSGLLTQLNGYSQ
ncbi:hypothetical protein K8I28_16105 [bacterium]|nr:hypothetical protein [bacterium]